MRHIFKCVECGADFEKVDAGVLCEACRNKPVKEPVSEVKTEPKPKPAKAKPTKKAPAKKGK